MNLVSQANAGERLATYLASIADAYDSPGIGVRFSAAGGGAYRCKLNNCTASSNEVMNINYTALSSYSQGDGASDYTLNNWIILTLPRRARTMIPTVR